MWEKKNQVFFLIFLFFSFHSKSARLYLDEVLVQLYSDAT